MPKTNWMIKFDKQLKAMQKPSMEQKQYRSDEELDFKLGQLVQHFSTEIYRLTPSSVIRALIHSFYEMVFKKEK